MYYIFWIYDILCRKFEGYYSCYQIYLKTKGLFQAGRTKNTVL